MDAMTSVRDGVMNEIRVMNVIDVMEVMKVSEVKQPGVGSLMPASLSSPTSPPSLSLSITPCR